MRKRRKYVFRDDEEERQRVRNELSKAMTIRSDVFDDEWDWGGNYDDVSYWRDLFPSQEDVLSKVQEAITNAEKVDVSN